MYVRVSWITCAYLSPTWAPTCCSYCTLAPIMMARFLYSFRLYASRYVRCSASRIVYRRPVCPRGVARRLTSAGTHVGGWARGRGKRARTHTYHRVIIYARTCTILTAIHPPCMEILPDVAKAIASGSPVVALETTIVTHGMPYPENHK